MDLTFPFTTNLWEYQGEAPWFFLTVPAEYSDEIRETTPPQRGFGSVKVSREFSDRLTVGSIVLTMFFITSTDSKG